MSFPESSLVWVPDSQAKFVPARVLRTFVAGEVGRVALVDDSGKTSIFEIELDAAITQTLTKMDEESLGATKHDMVDLKELNDASIMHNLRVRFLQPQAEIYTAIGDVLVAINPFKLLPIYTPLSVDRYITQDPALPPHIFRFADEAFCRLVEHKRDQACMVTGESGAGKTETTKLFLQYLAEVSSSRSTAEKQQQHRHKPSNLSDRILKSNPLLESFGNAVTRKNHNSSRFGKMICVNLDTATCEITSAKSTIFLLEKSRLPIQDVGERNFHVFYQLCAAAKSNAQIQQKYKVPEVDECRYLAYSSASSSNNHATSDLLAYELVQRSMTVLNFSPAVQGEIFSIVSAILHLGNLEFAQDDGIHNCEASKITSKSWGTLQTATELLGLPSVEILHSNLCYKSVQAGGKEAVKQPQSLDRSRKSRDALAIHLYTLLFEFVTQQVNTTLSSSTAAAATTKSIAILDIFGFEAFDGPNNSFEQLCINYCNEKLQQTFNDVVFSKERALYEAEGLSKHVNFEDMLYNTHKNTLGVLDMFERPRLGIFALLDEECSVPGGTDASFLKKLNQENARERAAYYGTGKKNLVDSTFVIKHYVGPVAYLVKNFLEKNDGGFLSKDLHLLCLTSSHSVLNNAQAPPAVTNAKLHLASQFANQLDTLVKELEEMESSFVRCIKPNAEFLPNTFNAGMVLDQLKCAGIMEVCRIRQLGFPVRRTFQEFSSRYGPLLALSKHVRVDEKLMGEMMHRFDLAKQIDFACGKTRVFLKNHSFAQLELLLAKFKAKHVIKIQRRFRGYFARKRARGVKLALQQLDQGMKNGSVEEIHAGLEQVRKWFAEEGGGKHLVKVQLAWKQLSQLEEMRWSVNLISRSILSKDANQIRSAIACTTAIVPQDHKVVLQAKQALRDLQERDQFTQELNECIATSTDPAKLRTLLDRSGKYQVDSFTLEKARAKLVRLEQDHQQQQAESATQSMLEVLRDAVTKRDPLLIARQLVVLFQNGLELHPEAQNAMQLERALKQELQGTAELQQMERVLEMKKENVTDSDLVLVEVIGRKNSTLKQKADRVMRDAQDKVDAQQDMLRVLDLGEQCDFAQLRAALERAYACGIKTGETVYRVQKLMRSKNRTRRLAKKHRVVIDVQGPVPEKLSKHVVMLRNETRTERDGGLALIAEATETDRYLLHNYYQIRAPDENSPVRTRIQCLGSQVLDRAILESTPQGPTGEMVSKLLLGYTGEKSSAFPATCATSLLEMGMNNQDVGDEVYVQICAHLTGNMSSESATRAWQLLCLAIGTYYPSGDLLFYIIRFLIDRAEGRTDAALPALAEPRPKLSTDLDTYTLEQRYAWYALKRLQSDLTNEVINESVPSSEEICAFGERVPWVTNITYPDGSLLFEDMIISPLDTCQDIVSRCLRQSGIHQIEMGPSYGLFARPVDRGTMHALSLQPPTSQAEEEEEAPQSPANRFRLSITAVFGFARASIAQRRDSLSRRRASYVAAPAAPVKAKMSFNVRRTDEELDWDVPLLPTDYVSDVLLKYLRAGRGAPRLVFKKRIFVPEFERLAQELREADAADEANVRTSEAMQHIELLQAVDDFSTGALPFDLEDDVVDVVACRVALKFDNRLPANDAERLMQIGQVELMIPATWKTKKTEINWAKSLLERKAKVNGRDTEALQAMILAKCVNRPLFGMQLFRVTQHVETAGGGGETMAPCVLACSKQGFIQVSNKDYSVIGEIPFADIAEYSVTKSQSLTIKWKQPEKEDLVFYSSHAKEICEVASEYEGIAGVLASLLPEAQQKQEQPVPVVVKPAPSTPSQVMLHPPTSPAHDGSGSAAQRGMFPRKNTTSHRGSLGDTGDSQEQIAAVANHSIREQMEKLGATENDINQVLRVAQQQQVGAVPGIPPLQMDKLRKTMKQ